MQAQGKRHRRLPGAYGSVGSVARVKYVQFRLTGPQIDAWAEYPAIHFRAAAGVGYEYHFLYKMVARIGLAGVPRSSWHLLLDGGEA
jgi:hypothetical protein